MTKIQSKTSESVSWGHPDKIADQIADNIFDHLRTYKEEPQCAVEVLVGATKVLICGEIDADIVKPQYSREIEKEDFHLTQEIREIALETIQNIGYTSDLYNPEIIINVVTQSPQINKAVENIPQGGYAAGDQGIVSGFATSETPYGHELHYILANRLIHSIQEKISTGAFDFLYPDAKAQCEVIYEHNDGGIDKPIAIGHILLSHSHKEDVTLEYVREFFTDYIIHFATEFVKNNTPLLNEYDRRILIDTITEDKILVNPAGVWTTPGPKYDTGLTGRKLVVDNYGSAAPIGGGATAGKNSSKVDRSGAYYARNIAKSIVENGLAEKCLVQISFAIGVATPTSWNIETFGTERIDIEEIYDIIKKNYELTVSDMISLANGVSKFVHTSRNGNYTDDFPWERAKEFKTTNSQ